MNIRKVIPLSNDSAIIADAKNGLYMAHFDFGNRYAIKMFLSHINTELNDYLTTNDLYHAIKLSNGNFGFSTSRSGTVVTDLDFVPLYYLTREPEL